MTTRRAPFFTALALLALAAPAFAQPLPTAAEVLAKYQQALGGKDSFTAKKSIAASGEFTIPSAGMTGSFAAFSARPNKASMKVTIGGFGEVRSGFDGSVAWSMNPMEGPRLMQGNEKAQAADEAEFDAVLRDISRFKSAETVERTTLNGKACIKVKLVWQSGRESFDCYSAETGLLVGSQGKQESNMGTLETVTLYDDYKAFEGFLMPTKITIQVMGMDQVISIKEVKFSELPATTFELPAEIKALIK
jgi:hypothetical protein